jgi:pimeloyl-ACP methyl ester carboxylesterase
MSNTLDAPNDVRTAIAPDGVEIVYEVVGEGSPIAFLHGSFVGRGAFARQQVALGKHFRLLLITSRGHDGTDVTLPLDFGFATTEVADVCAVLDAENVSQTHLVAHSTGGATAFALARDHPGRVDKLVLIEPTLYDLLPTEMYQRVRQKFLVITEACEASNDMAAWDGMMEFAGGDKWHSLDEVRKTKVVNSLLPLTALLPKHGMRLMDFNVSEDEVRRLRAPTILFYADDSVFFEPSISARFESLRPDFQQVHVENSGHNIHHDQADQVNVAILDFLMNRDGTPAIGL